MLSRLFLISSLLFLALILSCSDKEDNPVESETVVGSGNLVTEDLTLPPFNSIDNSTVADINLYSADSQGVSITADDNVIDYFELSVSNGTLTVRTPAGVNFSNVSVTIDLAMTDLEEIVMSGVGDITGMNSFEVDSVRTVHSGVGNISLDLTVAGLSSDFSGVGDLSYTGTATRHNCSHSAVGDLLAFGLLTQIGNFNLSGIGNAQVYVASQLNVTISGDGSLYYKGDPTINQTITGTGHVIDAN
jgi:hypothetical protein